MRDTDSVRVQIQELNPDPHAPLRRRAEALEAIKAERLRQEAKHGHDRAHGLEVWLAILTEEVGEVAQALLQLRAERQAGRSPDVRAGLQELEVELTHTAAVAVAMLEAVKGELADLEAAA